MGLKEVKKELNNLDKSSLIKLIAELYKKEKSVKEFLDFYVSPDEDDLYQKCEKRIFEAFYPKRGDRLRLIEGKKAISDFRKLSGSDELLASLMLFYVETGVDFTNEFGDINESFYNSIESTYFQALQLLKKENALKKYSARAEMVVQKTYGIGWGFHDALADYYAEYYGSEVKIKNLHLTK